MNPPLKAINFPLDGIPSIQHIIYTSQLGVLHNLAKGALNPMTCVITEDNICPSTDP